MLASSLFGLSFGLFFFLYFLLAIPFTVFWILMIIDVAKREFPNPNDKIIWLLIVILVGFIGAVVYYFVIKSKDSAGQGNGEQTSTAINVITIGLFCLGIIFGPLLIIAIIMMWVATHWSKAVKITLTVIPILYILLVAAITFLIIGISKNTSSNVISVDNAMQYAQALFDQSNQYRKAHHLQSLSRNEQLCSYASKRVNELETNGGFDEHRGFNEDLADQSVADAYFANVGKLNEFYDVTQLPSQVPTEIKNIAATKNNFLNDSTLAFGCANADSKYVVFIVATAPEATPTPYVYNSGNTNKTYVYPTVAPYYTPTMSPQESAQLTQFQQDFNNTSATIQAGQQGH